MPPQPSSPKFCPRCGAFYRDLQSSTCPQCFGRLEARDGEPDTSPLQNDTQADAEHRALDDERYREQAFGGCAALMAIALVTLVAAVLIVSIGRHRTLPTGAPPLAAISTAKPVVPAELAGQPRRSLTAIRQDPAMATATIVRGIYSGALTVIAAPDDLPGAERDAFRIYAAMEGSAMPHSTVKREVHARRAAYIVYAPNAGLADRAVAELMASPARRSR